MAYHPENPPAAYDAAWLRQELNKIREEFFSKQPFAFLDKQFVAPDKPREGMLVLADGVKWNPGKGPGYYGYFGGQWRASGLPTNALTKADVGLGNVDNTSDAAKPISIATQAALNGKANLSGASFSGNISSPQVVSVGFSYAGNGSAWLSTDGNVFGNAWGGYLSAWIGGQLAGKVGTVAIDRAGLDGGNPNKPCMASGSTVVYLIRNLNGSLNSGNRQNGYLEWATDIGPVGTNYFTSDERKKENIVESTVSALGVLGQLKFYSFNYKKDVGQDPALTHRIGVIAQQIQPLDPTFVSELSDGSLMPNEFPLLCMALKAIQELKSELEELKTKLPA